MRQAILYIGVALLVVGGATFVAAAVEAQQAAVAFMNCLNGNPGQPPFGLPSACAGAMGTATMWQAFEGPGAMLGVVGLIMLVLGVVPEPERPVPVYVPYYPPPVYAPPPANPPPQGPQTPPPQP